ncbi:MAG: ABC transporter permease, partial [Candidatus Ranarchaeia archaeon]
MTKTSDPSQDINATGSHNTIQQDLLASLAGEGVRPPSLTYRFLHNKNCIVGGLLVFIFVLAALFADFLTPYSPIEVHVTENFAPLSPVHPFGTDILGRDTFSRVIHGSRISIYIALVTTLIGLIVAVPIGLTSGYVGGKLDAFVVGAMDI